MKKLILIIPLATLATAALTQPPRAPMETGFDPNAAAAIERADLSEAERRLERRLAKDSGNVPAMLNPAPCSITSAC